MSRKPMRHFTVVLVAAGLGLGALAQNTQTTAANNVDQLFLQAARAGNAFEIETSKLALQKGNASGIKSFAQMMITDHTKAQNAVESLMKTLGGGSMGGTGSSGSGASTSGGTGTSGSGTTTSGGSGSTGTTGSSSGTTASGSGSPPAPSAQNSMNQNYLSAEQVLKLNILSALTAQAFDKAYIKEQVDAHESTIQIFTYAAKSAQNAEVKAFATQTLPTLEKHYREALALNK